MIMRESGVLKIAVRLDHYFCGRGAPKSGIRGVPLCEEFVFFIADMNLCVLTENDMDAVCQWRNNPKVSRFLGHRVRTLKEAREWFHRITDDPNNLLKGIEFGGELVGYGIVEDVDLELGKCQIGIVIGKPEVWGKGIGKAVVKELLHYCFKTLDLNRVLAVVA
jgi:RimJ/RimL family protein N-acetyltransferase